MFLVGIIAETKEYQNIKRDISEIDKNNKLDIFHITNSNIKNFQNIKFDTIIVMKALENFYDKLEVLSKILKQVKYLICNADISIQIDFEENLNSTIITYGFNSKSTVVISSVTEESLLIDLQREIELTNGRILEAGEHIMKRKEHLGVYENLGIFIILLIYFQEHSRDMI